MLKNDRSFAFDPAQFVADQLSAVSQEAKDIASTGPISRAYDLLFIQKCAAIDSRDLFNVTEALRANKNFRINHFKSLVKEELNGSFKPHAKTNGHAPGGWTELLLRTEKGKIKPILANAITALRLAPEWHGVLAFNELSCRLVKLSPPPYDKATSGDWTDEDDILTAEWLQRRSIEAGVQTAAHAAQAVSHEAPFHPIRQYLSSLQWDGEKRIQRWLTTYLGVQFSDYACSVGAKWLISAVARVMSPGSQVDTCLVLEGEQGIRKSSSLRVLAGDDWFTDQLSDLANKDSSQDLNGKWIVEFSDLGQMSRSEEGVLKAFISRRIDHYRQSYGRRTQDFPRQCIFAATTNKDNWAKDETGARRFWPIRCGAIDLESLRRDRDQLWAEAFSMFQKKATWWLDDDAVIKAAKEEQAERFENDVWEPSILKWINEKEEAYDATEEAEAAVWKRPAQPFSVTTEELLAGPINKPVGSWTAFEKTRVARILLFNGFVKFKKYICTIDGIPIKDAKTGGYKTERRYKRKTVTGI